MALLKNGSTRWKNALSTGLTEIDRSVTKLVRDLQNAKIDTITLNPKQVMIYSISST